MRDPDILSVTLNGRRGRAALSVRELVAVLGLLVVVVAFLMPFLNRMHERSTADHTRYEAQSIVAGIADPKADPEPVASQSARSFEVVAGERPRVHVLPALPDETGVLLPGADEDVD